MSSTRYGVYPTGSYSIGDLWYAVDGQTGTTHSNTYACGWVNGAFGWIWCGDWGSPWVCRTCTDYYTTYTTRYKRYRFNAAEWQRSTGMQWQPSGTSGFVYVDTVYRNDRYFS